METIMIQKEEPMVSRKRAGPSDELFSKLIRGLEDIRGGKIKPWKRTIRY